MKFVLQVLDLQRALHADPNGAGGSDTLDLRDITSKVRMMEKNFNFESD